MPKKTPSRKKGGRQGKKSASPKYDLSKPADRKKMKKRLLQAYLDLKKKEKDPNKEFTYIEFLESSKGITKYQVEKTWRSFTALKDAAEEEFRRKLPKRTKSLLSERAKKFDPNATKEDCINDLRRVQEERPLDYISRTDYRNEGKYSDSTWSQHFGTFQGFRQAAGLELTRSQSAMERYIAKHASIDHYREFFDAEVLPYYNKYLKEPSPYHIKKILAMSDLHDKECCEFSLSVFINTCKRMQPDIIVLNGDIFDLLEFGRYNIDPRHYDIKGRFDFVKENVFAALRHACPHAQIDFIAGNHEMRLLKLMADKTPNVRILLSDVMDIGFPEVFGLDEFEINWASKFDLAAYSKTDMSKEIKKNYVIYYDSFVFSHKPDKRLLKLSGSNGHHHTGLLRSHNYIDPDGTVRRNTWSQTPGMHHPDAEYLDNVSGWNTGFLEVTINTKVRQANQKIHFTNDDWCEINGVYYERKE